MALSLKIPCMAHQVGVIFSLPVRIVSSHVIIQFGNIAITYWYQSFQVIIA